MTIFSAGQLTNLRDTAHITKPRLTVFPPDTLLAARINDGTIARGERSIAYDTGSGATTYIRSLQELWVGTGPGQDDVGRLLVRDHSGSASSGTFDVYEHGLDLEDELYLTLKHFYPIVRVPPRINSAVFYKFFDLAYAGQNGETATPPVCLAGADQVIAFVSPSVVFNFDLSDSYAMAPGATISSYALSVAPATGAAVVFNTGTGVGTVTVTQAGFWWVTASCTDSNGTSQERFVLIAAPAAANIYRKYTRTQWSELWMSGAEVKIRAVEDVALSEFPDNTIAVFFHENYFDGVEGYVDVLDTADYTHVALQCYLRKDSNTDDLAMGTSQTEFTFTSVDQLIANISNRNVGLRAVGNPTKWWHYTKQLTTGRAIHHYWRWHSTIMHRVDVLGLMDNGRKKDKADFEEGNMWDAANTMSFQRGYLARLVSDRLGRIHLTADSTLLNASAASALDTIMTITEADVSGEITYVRDPELRYHAAQISGLDLNGGGTGTPYIAIIPGYRESGVSYGLPDDKGTQLLNQPNQLLSSQADANQKVGRLFAQGNRDILEFRIRFRGYYQTALTTVPSFGFYRLNIPAGAIGRGLDFTSLDLVCRSVYLEDRVGQEPELEAGAPTITAAFEPRWPGPDGIQGNYPASLPQPVPPASPGWDIDDGTLEAWLAFATAYYRDTDDTDWEETVANTISFNNARVDPWWPIVQQSTNPEKVIWLGCGQGTIYRVVGKNGTPVDVTPLNDPPNTWSDATAPTSLELNYLQVLPDPWLDGRWYALGVRQEPDSGFSYWESWIAYTEDRGDSWAWAELYTSSPPTEALGIWMAINGSHLLLTFYRDDGIDTKLFLQDYDPSDFSIDQTIDLGVATLSEVQAKTYIAYPKTALDDASLWYVFGRMNAPQSLANPEHIIKTANAGAAWSSRENGFGSNYCGALIVTSQDTDSNREVVAVEVSN